MSRNDAEISLFAVYTKINETVTLPVDIFIIDCDNYCIDIVTKMHLFSENFAHKNSLAVLLFNNNGMQNGVVKSLAYLPPLTNWGLKLPKFVNFRISNSNH